MKIQSHQGVIALALGLVSEGDLQLAEAARKALKREGILQDIILPGPGFEGIIRELASCGKLAGAIGNFMSPRWVHDLQQQGVPVVQLGQWDDQGIPCVGINEEIVAMESLRSFLKSGIQSVSYIGPAGPSGSSRLGELFRCKAVHHGVPVEMIQDLSPPILQRRLKELHLPSGLLCFSDQLAGSVIRMAKDSGLRIPRDLAVIGVGNERMESVRAGIGISSFEASSEIIGRKSGELLAKLLHHVAAEGSILIAPRFHARESSMRNDSGVDRALAYLHSYPESPVNVGELARIAGMSRRSFETAMKAERGETPGNLLIGMRRKRAEELLQSSHLPIGEIANLCGYREPALFSTAFKRWTGRSPREFRQLTESKGN